MHPHGPQASDHLTAASWIEPRLLPRSGALVGRMVPTGYEAYARILHPAADRDRNRVTWAEVARFTGRTMHPLVQWHRLVGTEDSFGKGGLWPGRSPWRGELDQDDLTALVDVLARHTVPDDCWFCWDVHGHADGPPGSMAVTRSYLIGEEAPPEDTPPSIPPGSLPRVHIANQRYLLARGPLRTAMFIGSWTGSLDTFIPEPPALWWPQDQGWFVGSDMDIDSTVIGGSALLIEDVLADPRLEAFPVGPHDSLMWDADVIN